MNKIIIKEYYELSGGKRIGEEAYIKEFAHGGMSSGSISDLWLDYIPLLKYRLIELNNNYYSKHKEFSKRIQPEKRLRPNIILLMSPLRINKRNLLKRKIEFVYQLLAEMATKI